jgi:hypothetical protein
MRSSEVTTGSVVTPAGIDRLTVAWPMEDGRRQTAKPARYALAIEKLPGVPRPQIGTPGFSFIKNTLKNRPLLILLFKYEKIGIAFTIN